MHVILTLVSSDSIDSSGSGDTSDRSDRNNDSDSFDRRDCCVNSEYNFFWFQLN